MKKWLISTVSAGALFAATNVAAQTEAPKPTTAADTVANPATIADATQDDAQTDDIVVTGLRRSLQSAQNIKRNAEGIVDSIVAEDIGKLPDVTASAALARVTGVQVTRAAGEAAGVQIRGLPAHCLAFCSAVTVHHTDEDSSVFPQLAAEVPELADVLAEISHDHLLIAGILQRVQELVDDLDRDNLPHARDEIEGLAAVLESHFRWEERRIIGVAGG